MRIYYKQLTVFCAKTEWHSRTRNHITEGRSLWEHQNLLARSVATGLKSYDVNVKWQENKLFKCHITHCIFWSKYTKPGQLKL